MLQHYSLAQPTRWTILSTAVAFLMGHLQIDRYKIFSTSCRREFCLTSSQMSPTWKRSKAYSRIPRQVDWWCLACAECPLHSIRVLTKSLSDNLTDWLWSGLQKTPKQLQWGWCGSEHELEKVFWVWSGWWRLWWLYLVFMCLMAEIQCLLSFCPNDMKQNNRWMFIVINQNEFTGAPRFLIIWQTQT